MRMLFRLVDKRGCLNLGNLFHFNNEAVVSHFNIKIEKGDFIAITGESGKKKPHSLSKVLIH